MKTHEQLATEAIGFPPSPLTAADLERLKRLHLDRQAKKAAAAKESQDKQQP